MSKLNFLVLPKVSNMFIKFKGDTQIQNTITTVSNIMVVFRRAFSTKFFGFWCLEWVAASNVRRLSGCHSLCTIPAYKKLRKIIGITFIDINITMV